jgi:glycine/D-amino acid oxidase-like deaminating enzyme
MNDSAPTPLIDGGVKFNAARVLQLTREALARSEADGRAGPALARKLREIERQGSFTRRARRLFQDLLGRLGVVSADTIDLPADAQPFWLREGHPLAGYQSAAEFPAATDVAIIGAGLTGASAAYHLADAVRERGLRVVILDRGDPATEASGRNGGNFGLLPENSVGIYEGLSRERLLFLERRYRHLPKEVLHAESERQASLVLGLSLRNRGRLAAIIHRERIDCDFAPRGWLYLAHSEPEEQGLCDEVTLAAQHGQRIELWSRRRIKEEFGFRTDFLGRYIPGDGTYHPFKYVCGVLLAALQRGVELYTRVRVQSIESQGPDRHCLLTDRGMLQARRLVVATNAFTRELLPKLHAIRPRHSQIMLTEHAPDRARGALRHLGLWTGLLQPATGSRARWPGTGADGRRRRPGNCKSILTTTL